METDKLKFSKSENSSVEFTKFEFSKIFAWECQKYEHFIFLKSHFFRWGQGSKYMTETRTMFSPPQNFCLRECIIGNMCASKFWGANYLACTLEIHHIWRFFQQFALFWKTEWEEARARNRRRVEKILTKIKISSFGHHPCQILVLNDKSSSRCGRGSLPDTIVHCLIFWLRRREGRVFVKTKTFLRNSVIPKLCAI